MIWLYGEFRLPGLGHFIHWCFSKLRYYDRYFNTIFTKLGKRKKRKKTEREINGSSDTGKGMENWTSNIILCTRKKDMIT